VRNQPDMTVESLRGQARETEGQNPHLRGSSRFCHGSFFSSTFSAGPDTSWSLSCSPLGTWAAAARRRVEDSAVVDSPSDMPWIAEIQVGISILGISMMVISILGICIPGIQPASAVGALPLAGAAMAISKAVPSVLETRYVVYCTANASQANHSVFTVVTPSLCDRLLELRATDTVTKFGSNLQFLETSSSAAVSGNKWN
jgi:hypothetical protein